MREENEKEKKDEKEEERKIYFCEKVDLNPFLLHSRQIKIPPHLPTLALLSGIFQSRSKLACFNQGLINLYQLDIVFSSFV